MNDDRLYRISTERDHVQKLDFEDIIAAFASVNDLPSAMQTVPRFFADDTALLTTENNVDNLQLLTNSELSRVSNWMLANNLVVNKAKTVALLVFPQTRKSTTSFILNFDNQIVQPSESAKLLGIFVGEHLWFKGHLMSANQCP